MSRRSPRWRASWRGSSLRELRPTAPPAHARRPAAVVVAARPAAGRPARHEHERRPARCRASGAPLDRPAAGEPAKHLPRRLDRGRGGAAHRRRAHGDPQRGDLDHPVRGPVEQHAGRRLHALQPHRRGQADRHRFRPGAQLGPDRARRVRGPGPHPGAPYHRLCGAGAGAARLENRHPRGRDGDRHRDRHGGQPAAPRVRKEQGDRAPHGRREQPRHGGSADRGAGRSRIRHQDLRDRGGHTGRGSGADGTGAERAALPDAARGDRRAADDRDRLDDWGALLPRHRLRVAAACVRGDQPAGKEEGGAGRVPALRRGVPRAPGVRAGRPGARDRSVRDVCRAGAVMSFDAPVVLALAPLVGGAVWFAAAWARRVRIRRAALWSEDTVRRALGAGRLGPTALSVAAFLGVVALAGPRWGEEQIVAETRGLSLVMAIDISRSMLAEDASPSRLRRALREARRLVQDLDGDRLGLIAFAGSSYIMSPLSIDGSALTLYLDALDPDMASQGGTGLAPALRQGGELLQASSELADRVLVVFTDGEAHDSLPPITAQAQRLKADGVRLILVAEGGRTPTRIPVRDDHGVLLGYQKDEDGRVIETTRRDDMLGAAADAAQGTLVAADLPDQAGAVRDLVASYRRARASETRTEQSRPRAWLPLMLGVVLLVAQAASRRTAALVGLAFACLTVPRASAAQQPQLPRSPAEKAWDRHDLRRARVAYLAELAARRKEDAAWYNAGTAALADSDAETAQASLAHAAASLDPDLRFRALYNLGLLALRQADDDSAGRDSHLADAERAYREALLLRPRDRAAKWNLELAIKHRGSSQNKAPPSGG